MKNLKDLDPKNLTVEEAVYWLPKNVAHEYVERQGAGELSDNFVSEVKGWLKTHEPKVITKVQLSKLDKRYFGNMDDAELTYEQAAYRLATWLFDHEGDEPDCRKKVKAQLPREVYVAMLEHFVDGDHDT